MNKILFSQIYPVTCHTSHVGPGSVFVAINGFKVQGSSFVAEAIERGARHIVLHESEKSFAESLPAEGVSFSFVSDCREALATLSSAALDYPSNKLKVIGITGTAGKTSTVFLIEHILRGAGYRTALLSSVENKIGDCVVESELTTPESDYLHMFFDACVKEGVDYVIMEVSSHALALKRVYGISFDAVGFTNLSPEHMDFHPTMEHYFETKFRLFSQVKEHGAIVINAEDEWGARAMEKLPKKVISFGIKSGDYKFSLQRSDFTGLSLFAERDDTVLEVSLFGEFNAYNLGMAYIICKSLGVASGAIVEALKTFPGVPGRLQMYKLKNGAIAFVDFAHKPSAFEAVLKTLRPCTDDLIVLFGCGGDRDRTKRPVMGRLAALYGDKVVVTDDNPRDEDRFSIAKEIIDGISLRERSKVKHLCERAEAIRHAVDISRSGSIIALLGKGHENYYLCKGKKYYFSDWEEIRKF